MKSVQLSEEEAVALQAAMQKEQKAQLASEAATLRQQWMEAIEAKNTLISRLAAIHGFEANQQLQYDATTRTLAER